jgi:hypothetical protein
MKLQITNPGPRKRRRWEAAFHEAGHGLLLAAVTGRSVVCETYGSTGSGLCTMDRVQQAWRARLIDIGAAVFPVFLPASILTEP